MLGNLLPSSSPMTIPSMKRLRAIYVKEKIKYFKEHILPSKMLINSDNTSKKAKSKLIKEYAKELRLKNKGFPIYDFFKTRELYWENEDAHCHFEEDIILNCVEKIVVKYIHSYTNML